MCRVRRLHSSVLGQVPCNSSESRYREREVSLHCVSSHYGPHKKVMSVLQMYMGCDNNKTIACHDAAIGKLTSTDIMKE